VGGKKLSDVLKALLQDILKIAVRKAVTEPLGKAIGDIFGSIFGSANGNVFMNSPGLSAYSGTVVNKPTLFPFASGIGLMGEAGPEAILPLKRGSDGKLGVSAAGGNYIDNRVYNIDARGAQQGVSEDIRRAIKEESDRTVDRSVNKVMDLNQRGALRFS